MSTLETTTTLKKWGNSKGLRLPQKVITHLNLHEDQKILIVLEEDKLILKPQTEKPTNIHELFSGWKDDGIRSEEMDWGQAEGEELNW
ncbi:AbrB/MazE/SpoVT family DNA-binding domain-containing protein (plasmid) [Macrococcoides bohemicum]|uniref:AbrB/MazE/SpoVT family DNA-binding domain-containing protein n=1 Tax=Macrococcoides bohemicum TaxID=1903056 RepID=UPI001C5E58A0|nr:AbrB/MazE/SpoVT family DNA-binding domain-containing protein [Macrococcus bohemicus]QYA46117.1 AbrB/MazE/SpoVT family DNA-binding domain-containing protein [Macrococcus bohemicus]